MYIIVNNTTGTVNVHTGSFPDLDSQLNKGEDIIVISLYSNTVKKPVSQELNGIIEWDWVEQPLAGIISESDEEPYDEEECGACGSLYSFNEGHVCEEYGDEPSYGNDINEHKDWEDR